jgi:hypothetical protein
LGDALQEAADAVGDSAPPLTQPLQAGSEALGNGDVREASQALEDLAEALDSVGQLPSEIAQTEQGDGEPDPSDQPQAGESNDVGAQQEQNEPAPPGQDDSAGQGAGEGDGEAASQPSEEERLAVEGQPLELESDSELEERVVQPAARRDEAGEQGAEDAPFARQPGNGFTRDLGPDLLTYPWDRREIIRRYFTP